MTQYATAKDKTVASIGSQNAFSLPDAKKNTAATASSKISASPKWRTSLMAKAMLSTIVSAIHIQDSIHGIHP